MQLKKLFQVKIIRLSVKHIITYLRDPIEINPLGPFSLKEISKRINKKLESINQSGIAENEERRSESGLLSYSEFISQIHADFILTTNHFRERS